MRVGTQGLFCPHLKTFVPPFLPTWLTAPGSPKMSLHAQQSWKSTTLHKNAWNSFIYIKIFFNAPQWRVCVGMFAGSTFPNFISFYPRIYVWIPLHWDKSTINMALVSALHIDRLLTCFSLFCFIRRLKYLAIIEWAWVWHEELCRLRRLVDNRLRDQHNFSHHTKAEFNIVLLLDEKFLWYTFWDKN